MLGKSAPGNLQEPSGGKVSELSPEAEQEGSAPCPPREPREALGAEGGEVTNCANLETGQLLLYVARTTVGTFLPQMRQEPKLRVDFQQA